MELMIHLSVGQLEAEWGRRAHIGDHSQLFQIGDLTQTPHHYVKDEDPDRQIVVEARDGLSKPLDQVIARADLLGYTMKHARREFENIAERHRIDERKFRFEQLAECLATVDVRSMSADYRDAERFGRFFRYTLFDKIQLEKAVDDPEYARGYAGEAMENLSAHTILQMVAQNPLARGLPVNWQLSEIDEYEGLQREEIVRPLDRENKFLIVTEGSSDAAVIKHALKLLKPHVADFFEFVDMNEGYPFTGTGNLYNFTKGLVGISVQNNIIVLYDNDAEGVFSFNRTTKLNLPRNMQTMKLPDLPKLRDVATVGPSGRQRADINGKAASIECYLDFDAETVVRWRSFHTKLKRYHGVRTDKREATKRFLAQSEVSDDYDFTGIQAVVETLIRKCITMRESARLVALKAK